MEVCKSTGNKRPQGLSYGSGLGVVLEPGLCWEQNPGVKSPAEHKDHPCLKAGRGKAGPGGAAAR